MKSQMMPPPGATIGLELRLPPAPITAKILSFLSGNETHTFHGMSIVSPLISLWKYGPGSISIDHAIGIGGLPCGRVVEIFGPESSGKTTLALSVVGQAQKRGGIAAYIDAEHALDAEYARKLGVDIDNMLVSQPDSGEQALEIAEMLVRSNAVDVVVIDSVAALVPGPSSRARWATRTSACRRG